MKQVAKQLYPEKLEKIILEEGYVPKKLKKGDRLKRYHRYWSEFEDSYFKVIDVYTIDKVEYYSIRYSNSLFGEISYPLNTEYIYELSVDYSNILKKNIINSHVSYLGSDIKYWFFGSDIDLNDPKFSGFWSFLDPNSKSKISDDKFYFLFADREDDIYKDCKMVVDKRKERRHH